MSFLDKYIFKNPMLAEANRVRKQFLSFRGPSVVALILVLIVGMGYLYFLLGVFQNRQDFDGGILVIVQSGVLALGIPIFFSSCIAGEREKRTWEVLICAPITKAQIVAGKIISASVGIGIAVLFNFLPILILLGTTNKTHFYKVFELEVNSLGLAALLVGLTLFVSAKSKSHYAALGSSLASIFLILLGLPIFLSILSNGSDPSNLMIRINPIALESYLASEANKVSASMEWEQFITMIVFAGLLVLASVRTINNYDHVKGIGKRVNA